MRHIEHQRARSIGHVDGGFTRKSQANVVFRQHDFADAPPIFRLMLADPQKLSQREICQRTVAGQLDQAIEADGAFKFFRLCFGALVAPDQCGANDFVVFVEQDSSVHLPGKPHGGDGIGGKPRRLKRFANGECRGSPPVARILFSPSRLRAGKVGVLFRA